MAVIRLGSARSPRPATVRRVEIGVPGLVALGEASRAAGVLGPPPDLLRGGDDPAFALLDVSSEVHAARAELVRRGVIADGRPAPAVTAGLQALGSSPHRVRLSLAGEQHDLLGYWWTDGRVGGSVVRDGAGCALSAFDAPLLGEELVGALPDPDRPAGPEISVPVDAFPVLAALEDVPDGGEDVVASATGVPSSTVHEVAGWSAGVEAVLLVTTLPSDPRAVSIRALVWFLHSSGWWSARLSRADGRRVAILRPARRRELAGWVAELTLEGWR